ncbi:mediator of RNA polymerase II transcription subunit 20-like [Penaeus indicus]|uniref:mediator of RNA polymerase II transcription subunit 20-like n=1 Tax=Penaeus indicus TaxID=29960 RepID=UPI00300CFD9A
MGVTVLQIFPDESRSGYQETEKLHKRIMHLDAVQSGMFIVDCDSYYTTAQNGAGQHRRLHIVHNSETPATTYAIIDTGTKQVTLSADFAASTYAGRGFDQLLLFPFELLQSIAISDRAQCALGNSMHYGCIVGIMLVEYLPCAVPALCWTLMREFMQSFMGSCVNPQAPPYIQNRFHDIHAAQDTVQQYVEKFNEFRDGSTYSGSQANAPNS